MEPGSSSPISRRRSSTAEIARSPVERLMPRQQEEYGSEHGLQRHDQCSGSFIGTVLSGRLRLCGMNALMTRERRRPDASGRRGDCNTGRAAHRRGGDALSSARAEILDRSDSFKEVWQYEGKKRRSRQQLGLRPLARSRIADARSAIHPALRAAADGAIVTISSMKTPAFTVTTT
jgi:hypothetical protein